MGCAGVVGTIARALDSQRIPYGEPTAAPEGDGWIDLFAEERREHWTNISDNTPDAEVFTFDNGEMHIFGNRPTRYIGYTAESFGDFELHVSFKVAPNANSGVFIRSSLEDPVYKGMEVQVLEDHGSPPSTHGSGSIYDVVSPMFNMARPAGEWNTYDITCRGSEIIVVMNGWKVIDTDLSKMTMPIGKFPTPYAELPQEGHIILQDHGGEVRFGALKIRPLAEE